MTTFIIYSPFQKKKFDSLTGNHTFAAVKGTESYSLLSSMNEALEGINRLLVEPCIDVAGKRRELRIVIGGDLKVRIASLCQFLGLCIK